MPLFEYQCRECDATFEALIRSGDALPRCPQCGAADVERLISMFAVSSEESRKASLKAAKKKVEQNTRDKAIADAEDIRNHRH
jgi:putative FmdB family regulatory protein